MTGVESIFWPCWMLIMCSTAGVGIVGLYRLMVAKSDDEFGKVLASVGISGCALFLELFILPF